MHDKPTIAHPKFSWLSAAMGSALLGLAFGLFQPKGNAAKSEPEDLVYIPGPEGFISSWLQLGPLKAPAGLKRSLDRLGERDPLGLPSLSQPPKPGGRGAGATWKVRLQSSKALSMKGSRPATAYLAALLRTKGPRRIRLATGTDGGIEIWSGGKLVLLRNLEHKAYVDTNLVDLNLPDGDTLLVIKLWRSRPGPWRCPSSPGSLCTRISEWRILRCMFPVRVDMQEGGLCERRG